MHRIHNRKSNNTQKISQSSLKCINFELAISRPVKRSILMSSKFTKPESSLWLTEFTIFNTSFLAHCIIQSKSLSNGIIWRDKFYSSLEEQTTDTLLTKQRQNISANLVERWKNSKRILYKIQRKYYQVDKSQLLQKEITTSCLLKLEKN